RLVPKGGLVVEIGSNDGTLLRAFDRGAVRVLGVEPARNIAAMANAAGTPTLDEFFSEAIAAEIVGKHGRASAIIGNNVVAHIDDLQGLMNGVTALLEEGRSEEHTSELQSRGHLVCRHLLDKKNRAS